MILESIVTTRNADGSPNISPMGPMVDTEMQRIVLRPFQTSTTYGNLKRTGVGVLHVTDDVLLFAQAAVGTPDPLPPLATVGDLIDAAARGPVSESVRNAPVIADACRWYAFEVRSIDDAAERTTIHAEIVANGQIRDFFGFNRAKHAVIEAAILATRVAILPVGLCYPGRLPRGGDAPPRPECAPTWQPRVLPTLRDVRLRLLVGGHAIRLVLGKAVSLEEAVRGHAGYLPGVFPLPHPSWRTRAWAKRRAGSPTTCPSISVRKPGRAAGAARPRNGSPSASSARRTKSTS